MGAIRVVIHGALGRMGQEVLKAVRADPQLEVVGAVEKTVKQEYLPLDDSPSLVPYSSNLEFVLKQSHPDVLVDFTTADATMSAVPIAVKHHTNLVIGTTGFSSGDLALIDELAREWGVGAVVAPNFALGAMVMTHLAKLAAKFFDYAEIIEMHHEQKLDAPSGTALSTSKAMVESRGKPFISPPVKEETASGSRGSQYEGIAIHSVRMPGLLAHQEIILGGPGQTLHIRHDALNRECYMPGIILAIKKVCGFKGLVYGLDKLLE
jgi:4-hydroxy-tetrahydrodipicolinate reductase